MLSLDQLKTLAYAAGFDLCGVAEPSRIDAAGNRFDEWLGLGYAGEMQWLARDPSRRTEPERVLRGVKSIIMLGMNYYQGESPALPLGKGRVSRYAWGRDYHEIIEQQSKSLIESIHAELGGSSSVEMRAYVDYGPILERSYGVRADLGYIGKNAMLINREFGSWIFLSAILTSLAFRVEAVTSVNHGRCGECTRCIDACPTGAIVGDGVIDSRLCISYLTIERPSEIPEHLQSKIGDWIFGCDVCQDVCPHNGRQVLTRHKDFNSEHGAGSALPLDSVIALESETAFRARFDGTPLTRPGLANLQRNARIVAENQKRKT